MSSFYLSQANGELAFKYEERASLPTPTSRVLVVGGSVTGLTTAWALLDAGYAVTVVSDQWAPSIPRVTGQVAGALLVSLCFFSGMHVNFITYRWEYPPAVCGKHTDVISLAHSKAWSLTTNKVFTDIIASAPPSVHGLRMTMANFFFERPIKEIPEEHQKMLELMEIGIDSFRHDAGIINELAINPDSGSQDSYQHKAPAIDTDAYLVFLRELVLQKGATLVTGRISGDLLASEDSLLATYDADVIVNASGLASWE